jgi:hypothetical protein
MDRERTTGLRAEGPAVGGGQGMRDRESGAPMAGLA